MMKRSLTLTLAALGFGTGIAHADNGLAVGVVGGTTGGSIEGQAQITPYVQARGGYNFFDFGVDETWDGISYSGDLDLSNFGVFADLRPWGGSFIVTGGAYIGDKGLNVSATPTATAEVGDVVYTSTQVGTLTMDAKFRDIAPFIGLGFDTTFQGSGRWGFRLIGGAMFSGSPDVTLTSTGGSLSGDPLFQAEIAKEEARLQDDVDDFEVYPVVQVALTRRF